MRTARQSQRLLVLLLRRYGISLKPDQLPRFSTDRVALENRQARRCVEHQDRQSRSRNSVKYHFTKNIHLRILCDFV